jgi:hypothetical protein
MSEDSVRRFWQSKWTLTVPLGVIVLVALLMHYLGVVPD